MDSFHRFTDLSLDTALRVLEHELRLQPYNDSAPSVLLALASLKNTALYQEASRLYHYNNFNLTSTNLPVLRSKSIKELLPIKHIKILLPLPLRFLSAPKITAINRLETIIFVLDEQNREWHNSFSGPAMELMRASFVGVRRVVVRAQGRCEPLIKRTSLLSGIRNEIFLMLQQIDTHLGLEKKKTQISGDDVFTV